MTPHFDLPLFVEGFILHSAETVQDAQILQQMDATNRWCAPTHPRGLNPLSSAAHSHYHLSHWEPSSAGRTVMDPKKDRVGRWPISLP